MFILVELIELYSKWMLLLLKDLRKYIVMSQEILCNLNSTIFLIF